MNREVHAPFCERPEVKSLGPTHPGTTTKMTRLRGRCLKGQRLSGKAPFGHWMTETFVAGLRCDKLTAPFVIDAPMNRRIFETHIEKERAPTLAKGDVSSWTIWRPTRARPPRRRSKPGCMDPVPTAL